MKLVEFLTNVVSDRDWQGRFCEDPGQAIRQAKLSREAMKAIESGNPLHVAFVICSDEAPAMTRFDPVD